MAASRRSQQDMLPNDLAKSPKLSRDLRAALAQEANARSLRVIVRHRPGVSSKLCKSISAEPIRRLPRFQASVLEISPRALSELEREESVLMLWHDFRVRALLDRAVPAVGGPLAWEHGLSGKDVVIAVLDTGVDAEHPDLRNALVGARAFVHEAGTDEENAAEVLDYNGHGTHVAGIAVGSGEMSSGRFRGLAPGASLLVGKVLDGTGSGNASDVIAGLEWALAEGAHVACLSLGGDIATDGSDALSVACDEFAEQGLLICAAAGNSGPRPYSIGSPGCAREVLTVGAADLTGAEPVVARFSSRGPTADGRHKPDVVLPGVAITSCRSRAGFIGKPDATHPEHYCVASGTSMATPLAAAFCALLLQAAPDATPREIKALLASVARSIPGGPDAAGAGMPHFAHVLEAPPSAVEPGLPPEERAGCLVRLLSPFTAVFGRLRP